MSRKQNARFTRAQKRLIANKSHPEETSQTKSDKNSIIIDAQTDIVDTEAIIRDMVPWKRPLPEFDGFDKISIIKDKKPMLEQRTVRDKNGLLKIEFFMEGDEPFTKFESPEVVKGNFI